MIQILQEAALKGGEVLRSYFRKNLSVQAKTSHQNLVTKADLDSQKIIKEYLEKEMTRKYGIDSDEIGFIGEEGLYKKGKYMFVIDPLDGTSNFASGFEYFGIVIGVFINDVLTHGLIYQPIQDKMFYGQKDKGSYKRQNHKTIQLQVKKTDLKKMFYGGGFSNDNDLRKLQMDMYHKLFPHFRNFLSVYAVSCSIGLFLDGILGAYFGGGPKIWDLSGGKLLIEEAGGVITNWYGGSFEFDLEDSKKTYPNITCHPDNLQKILKIMK